MHMSRLRSLGGVGKVPRLRRRIICRCAIYQENTDTYIQMAREREGKGKRERERGRQSETARDNESLDSELSWLDALKLLVLHYCV